MKCLWIAIFTLIWGTTNVFPVEQTTPNLALDLRDGSRVIGTSTLTALSLRSDVIGEMNVPLDRVSQVKFDKYQSSASITLRNGDKLSANVNLSHFEVTTVFGKVRIPMGQIRQLQVRPAGALMNRDGLILYLKLDEAGDIVRDESGHNHHGTVHGAVFEPLGNGLGAHRFNGQRQMINVPRTPVLDPGEQVSVLFWMKLDGKKWKPRGCQGLVTTDFYQVELCVEPSIHLSMSTDGVAGSTHSPATGNGEPVNADEWYHVAATYDGTSAKLYLNGKQVGNTPVTGTITPMLPGSFLSIGSEDGRTVCQGCVGQRYFAGLLREVKIYRRAVNEDEITADLHHSPP
jgi:hypothetical protein